MPSTPLRTLRAILSLFCRIHIHPAYFIVPIAISLAAAVFEGVGFGLLIPLLQGFFEKDFSFLKEAPVLGAAVKLLPQWIVETDKWLFAFLLGLFVVSMFLKNILKYCSLLSVAFIGNRAVHHLRKVLFARYVSFGKLYFDTTHIGHHSAVLSQFAPQALAPFQGIGGFINSLFSLIVYLVLLTFISWKLTFFALPLLFLLHFAVRRLIAAVQRISRSTVDRAKELSQKVVEILSSIPLVQSSNMEDEERMHFTHISDERAKLDFRKHAVQALILPLQETLTLFAILLLFSGMLYLMVRAGESTAPSFIVYFYLVVNVANKFGSLTAFHSSLASAAASVEEVEDILDDSGKYFVPSGKERFASLKGGIEFRKLRFTYPSASRVSKREGNAVLHDLSFRVEPGTMTAIVGPTGAGKTTIINLILRFYDCEPGAILVDGTDIREYDIASLHDRMTLVSQDTLLFHDTLRNNIAYGVKDVSDKKLHEVLEQARLSEFVSGLPEGLDTLIGDRGVKLSGGEKQRVSIARALLKDADILILDEATSSLDSRTERLIQEAIDEAVEGRTSIVIAHRLSTIKHADRIVVIDEGRATEQGTLDELLEKNGLFKIMWEEQKFIT